MMRTLMREHPVSSRLILYAMILLIACLFIPAHAMAHKPIFVERMAGGYDDAYPIPDATTSYAVYGNLTAPRQVDVFQVTVTDDTPFYARLSVPKKAGSTKFAPALVLIGPGLPKSNVPPNYPLALPDDLGRGIYLYEQVQDEFFEPFTQTTLLQRQFVSRKLQPGTYYLAVYDPDGQLGKYVLATGTEERFSTADWLKFPATWLKVRLWYDAGQTLGILALVTGVLGVLFYSLRRLRER
ncbi:hypothetical protein [Tumebacillus permanentifrigoris]|uniref:Uncharacterized protein n=1 Tax=Tumebacillus permanentifrigoris TaxID=378543 RepID=A0A316DYV6_9BACL|nr:hypothetical protein [Tumebacillus permanentifrigoris]PWK15680.1 hypothetical protein C7459_103220 [Tumebacillus permanentifrigoris]